MSAGFILILMLEFGVYALAMYELRELYYTYHDLNEGDKK